MHLGGDAGDRIRADDGIKISRMEKASSMKNQKTDTGWGKIP